MSFTLAQKSDVDGKTVMVKENQLHSRVVFTERELHVPANAVTKFVFRQLDNSDTIMACTGIEVGGNWYGDRPDNGAYLNPFTNETLTRGSVEDPFKDKVGIIIQESNNGVFIKFNNIAEDTFRAINVNRIAGSGGDGALSGMITPKGIVDAIKSEDVLFRSSNTVMAFSEEIYFEFEKGGKTYKLTLPRIQFENGLGAYAKLFDTHMEFNEWLTNNSTVEEYSHGNIIDGD